jgi:NTE family protein
VLSGGGARGLAHIGVLRALEEARLRPDVVVGTSMGAIVGSLYASGYSSADIERIVRGVDWAELLFRRTDAFAWRGNLTPRPLLQLGVGRAGLQLPTAPLDDAELNYLLSDLLLEGGTASGSFDRLPIPFRAVATDAATTSRVVLEHGPLARAVRASMCVPLLFAPVRDGRRLLVDGGLSDNLPVSVARDWGAERVIASDVAAELKGLDSAATAPAVALYMVRLFMQRQPGGTAGPGDLLVRLKLPGYSSVDYDATDSLVAIGYRSAAARVGAYADSAGLRRDSAAVAAPRPPLPPLSGRVEWTGLRSLGPEAASAALGRLPRGPLRPVDLRPSLARLYRASLFQSAWPSLEVRGDSTVLRLEVAEQMRRELSLAAAYGTDDGERVYAGTVLRAPLMPPIAIFELTGIYRRYGRALHVNLEPHALGRGGSGPFLRAGYREAESRLYSRRELAALPLTIRREGFLGTQLDLPARLVVQLALGAVGIAEGPRRWSGPLLLVRSESRGALHRLIEAEWMPGDGGYSRANAAVALALRARSFTLQPGLRIGAVDGDVPTDALVGLGGPLSLAGLHDGEWLGRRALGGEIRLVRPVGVVLRFHAAAQVGWVGKVVAARELGSGPQPAGVVGMEMATPVGPVRLDWGVGPGGRGRLDLMLGDRF